MKKAVAISDVIRFKTCWIMTNPAILFIGAANRLVAIDSLGGAVCATKVFSVLDRTVLMNNLCWYFIYWVHNMKKRTRAVKP